MSTPLQSQPSVKFGQIPNQLSSQTDKISIENPSFNKTFPLEKPQDLYIKSLPKLDLPISLDFPISKDDKSDKAKPAFSPSIFKSDLEKYIKKSELSSEHDRERQHLAQPEPSVYIPKIKPGIDIQKLIDEKENEKLHASKPSQKLISFIKKLPIVRALPQLRPTRVTVVRDISSETEESKINYTPLSFDKLFPDNVQTFRQRDVGNCYALSAFDGILQYPELLRTIQFEANRYPHSDKVRIYKVTFPSGLSAEFDAADVGRREDGRLPVDGPLGIQLLERAYAIVSRESRNAALPEPYPNGGRGHTLKIAEMGFPSTVLKDIFGEALSPEEVVTNTSTIHTEALNQSPLGQIKLTEQLNNIAADTSHTYILAACTPSQLAGSEVNPHLITIIKDDGSTQSFYRGHAYSIRNFNLADRTISIVDPNNTSQEMTLSFNEFSQAFWGIQGRQVAIAASRRLENQHAPVPKPTQISTPIPAVSLYTPLQQCPQEDLKDKLAQLLQPQFKSDKDDKNKIHSPFEQIKMNLAQNQ